MQISMTEFDGVPDAIVNRYDAQLRFWAVNFLAKGPIFGLQLKGPVVGVEEFDGNGERPVLVADLKAERQGSKMVIRPRDERSAGLLVRHAAALRS